MIELPLDRVLAALKAAGEPTRLRILVVLSRCELTVGELCRVLVQTQPRVSRHLRLLVDAGLLERHAQGTNAFYRPSRDHNGRRLFDAIIALIDDDEPALERALERLAVVRSERAASAAEYFETVASQWNQLRDLHVADTEVERAMIEALDGIAAHSLLDIGTGTGRVLELFADRIDHGLGIDLSQQMLNIARSRLDEKGLRNCIVRQGDVYDLDLDAGCMDVAVLHHVLHFLDDPASAITEVARTLGPGGRLIIVDFAPHGFESMREDHAHHWLGFDESEVIDWCAQADLVDFAATHLTPVSGAAEATLTVTVWTANQTINAPSANEMATAS